MNRKNVDPFFTLFFMLFAMLIVVFKAADYDFNGVNMQKKLNQHLFTQLKSLKIQLQAQNIESGLNKKNIHKKVNHQRAIASVNDIEVELNPAKLTKKLYNQVLQNCSLNQFEKKKYALCLNPIDELVSQFPENSLTGQSLLVLAEVNWQEKKIKNAEQILKIVKTEFRADQEIQKKISNMQRLWFD